MHKGMMFPLLDGILHAMNEIDGKFISLDDVLDDSAIIPAEMRRTAAHWLFSIYRYRVDIEKYIRNFSAKGKIKKPLFNLSVAAAAHCVFQNRVARESSINAAVEYAKVKYGLSESRFLNALLRRICREQVVFHACLPQDLRGRWSKEFGKEFVEQAEKCLSQESEQHFRLRKGFAIDGFNAEKIASDLLERFDFYKTADIDKSLVSECFRNGGIYIQDAATGTAVELLAKYVDREKGRFIDVCGAPGGKAIMFHDLFPQWDIAIGDRSAKRQERTKENLARLKIDAELLVCDAAEDKLEDKYDVLFADVPCSNSGVFRKRPDVLYRLNHKALLEIAKIQRALLENAADAVAGGGLLLYSTCSIEGVEPTLQIKDFCSCHSEFELLEERLTLPSIEHDGAYSACLRRKNDC